MRLVVVVLALEVQRSELLLTAQRWCRKAHSLHPRMNPVILRVCLYRVLYLF